MSDPIRIYVASLSDYNAGRLHGEWIELGAGVDADDVAERVAAMLDRSPVMHDYQGDGVEHCSECGFAKERHDARFGPAEEWAIHDHEGFGELQISEHDSFTDLCAWAEAIEEHGLAWAAYASDVGPEDALEHFEDRYQGEWSSREEFAQRFAEDIGEARTAESRWPYYCIDWERAARDLFLGDFDAYDAPGGMVYVFDVSR